MADPIEVLTSKIDSLAQGMADGFARVERRLDAHDNRFDGIDARLDGIDGRLEGHDGRFDSIDAQLRDIPAHFTELRGYIDMGFEKTQAALKADVGRLERKLDQFIDSELRR